MDKVYLAANSSWNDFVAWLGKEYLHELNASSKNAQDLFKEYCEGECSLYKTNHIIFREVDVVQLQVKHPLHPNKVLKETSQFFPQKNLTRQRDIYPSEKRKHNETIEQTAIRGLKEELGFHTEDYTLQFSVKRQEENISKSYKNLWSLYNMYVFSVHIIPALLQEKYTIEEEDGKISVFEWKKCQFF